jgi:uncharacterized membrane protein YedE/YeeE
VTAALAGGALIGIAAVWLMAANGRVAGISSMLGGLLSAGACWRAAFLIGLPLGAALAGVATGRPVIGAPQAGGGLALLAGLLVGAGAALGSGCTSGHGVCGLARLSPRSLVATATFIAVAALVVCGMRHAL